jgi:Glycosyltransferase family 87
MALNWLATLGCFALALDLILGPRRAQDCWPVALLAAVPTAAYLWASVRVGQVGAVLLLGCLGWAGCRRRGRPFLGGLLLAAACALKLAPGLLVPYLALRRDGRGLAGVLVGGLTLFLVPMAWVGWEGTVRLHCEWVGHTSATHVPEQTFRPGNQSLLAQLARLPRVSDGHKLYSAENLTRLHRLYPLLVLSLAAGLFLWIARDGRGASLSAEEQRRRENLHLILLLILLTVAHPRAWRCNYVALLAPCVLLAEQVWRRRPGAPVGLAALTVLALACAWPTGGVGEAGCWSLGAWLLLGKHFWAAVAVAVACWWCAAVRPRGSGSAPAGTKQFYVSLKREES